MATKRKKKATHADADADETPERERPLLDRVTDLRMDITDDQSAVARLLDIMIDEAGGNSDEIHEELTALRAEVEKSEDRESSEDPNNAFRFDDTTAGSPAV